MPKVTPELLRDKATHARRLSENPDIGESVRFYKGRASAFREIAAMLEAEEKRGIHACDCKDGPHQLRPERHEESAHLVIPHDPNYHCWGK